MTYQKKSPSVYDLRDWYKEARENLSFVKDQLNNFERSKLLQYVTERVYQSILKQAEGILNTNEASIYPDKVESQGRFTYILKEVLKDSVDDMNRVLTQLDRVFVPGSGILIKATPDSLPNNNLQGLGILDAEGLAFLLMYSGVELKEPKGNEERETELRDLISKFCKEKKPGEKYKPRTVYQYYRNIIDQKGIRLQLVSDPMKEFEEKHRRKGLDIIKSILNLIDSSNWEKDITEEQKKKIRQDLDQLESLSPEL